MTSAETDSDDRVRAFSTRVLGKLKNPACAPVFQRLLADRSQYVRMNAAWGLGELAATPEGRAVAKRALHALRRLEKTETVKDTRDAASLAARRLM
jgi:HEAT repeat protein